MLRTGRENLDSLLSMQHKGSESAGQSRTGFNYNQARELFAQYGPESEKRTPAEETLAIDLSTVEEP